MLLILSSYDPLSLCIFTEYAKKKKKKKANLKFTIFFCNSCKALKNVFLLLCLINSVIKILNTVMIKEKQLWSNTSHGQHFGLTVIPSWIGLQIHRDEQSPRLRPKEERTNRTEQRPPGWHTVTACPSAKSHFCLEKITPKCSHQGILWKTKGCQIFLNDAKQSTVFSDSH